MACARCTTPTLCGGIGCSPLTFTAEQEWEAAQRARETEGCADALVVSTEIGRKAGEDKALTNRGFRVGPVPAQHSPEFRDPCPVCDEVGFWSNTTGHCEACGHEDDNQ